MPVPSPRNSIRIARGNYNDLLDNLSEIGEGELCFALDQDKFYSKASNTLTEVGRGTAIATLGQIGDVDVSSVADGQFLQYNSTSGNWEAGAPGGAPVDSVNGQTGAVVIDADDISDTSTTNKFATAAQLGLADTSVQPGDNVSDLTNDAGYITLAQVPADAVTSVNTQTGNVVLDADDIDDSATTHKFATAAQLSLADNAVQPGDNISTLTNNSGFVDAAGASAAAPVQSVNTQTGAVVLAASDVGLGNVDNTSDANKPVSTAQQTALDAKADLVGGVIPTSQIPAIAITEFLGSVGSEAAMLALTGQQGDWCLRTDVAVGYVIIGADPSLIANWEAFTVPGSAVTSINSQVGTVVLGAADVGALPTTATSDNVTEGSTNLYSQWDNATGGINYAGGNVGIGDTDPSEKLEVNGNILASGDVTAFSDISLKENIEVIPNALDKVSRIRGVTYDRIDTEEDRRQSGVIAQEVEAVLPEVVHVHEDGIKSVAYGNLVGLLIESIKELKAEVEALKAERN